MIYNLYFSDKLSLSEISKKVDLSISQISRILSESPLYLQEKADRKNKNRIKHIEQTKELIKKKRDKKKAEEKALLDKLHYQASIELSYINTLSNAAIRKSCSSAYNYNTIKGRFEIKDDVAYSKDMPSKIKY